MKKKINLVLCLLLVVSMLFTACGSNGSESETPAGNDKEQVADNQEEGGVKDSLVVVYKTMPETIDPYASTHWDDQEVFIQIYDPLLGISPQTGEVELKLAENLTISEDGLEYVFDIRKGVKFSNGQELTSKDVYFSLQQAVASPKTNSKLGNVESLEIVDDYTFKIMLNAPYASFSKMLAYMFIVNEDAYTAAGEAYGDNIANYVGTGAFVPVEWEKGQFVRLEANEDYYEGSPAIKKLEFKAILEPGTASIAIESQEVDLVNQVGTDFIEIIEANKNLDMIATSSSLVRVYLMNTQMPPFDNRDFRMALAYACDRESMSMAATNGYSPAWRHYLEEGSGGLAEDIMAPEFNLDKAKEYLEKSGYGDGVEIDMQGLGTVKLDNEVFQADLAKIGVTVNLEAVETGTAYDNIFSGNYGISPSEATNVSTDADMFYRWYSNNSSLNLIHYINEDYEKILREARSTQDEAKRNELYAEAQKVVRDEALLIPIYNEVRYTAFVKGLKNVKMRADLHTEYVDFSW